MEGLNSINKGKILKVADPLKWEFSNGAEKTPFFFKIRFILEINSSLLRTDKNRFRSSDIMKVRTIYLLQKLEIV